MSAPVDDDVDAPVDPAAAIVDGHGKPARSKASKVCPQCGGDKRGPSCGFGQAHPVCLRCGYEWKGERWNG